MPTRDNAAETNGTCNRQGLVKRAMEEHFDIFDESHCLIGRAPRSQVHRQGLWHQSSNVFLIRSNGELVLNRRAIDKDVAPGKWDIAVGEHLKPGESFEEAACRGVREEFGIRVVVRPIGRIGRYTYASEDGEVQDREFQRYYYAIDDSELTIDHNEVMTVESISLAHLRSSLASEPERYTPWAPNLLAKLDAVPIIGAP